MKKSFLESRRSFLKGSAAGAAAVVLGGAPRVMAGTPDGSYNNPFLLSKVWTKGMAINPAISNMRVVYCHDTSMITGAFSTGWNTGQLAGFLAEANGLVDTAKVAVNLDKMAMKLAQTGTAAEAWAKIFQKPASRANWSDVRVAFKVNKTATFCTVRPAVLGKVANELIKLGVKPQNIIVYDGHMYPSTEAMSIVYGAFQGDGKQIPAGVNFPEEYGAANDPNGMGGITNISAPTGAGAYENARQSTGTYLADHGNSNKIDIMVNFAPNKGNAYVPGLGNSTIALKNHYGTMQANHDSLTYLFFISQCDIVLGDANPCRQQLVVLDSLWAQNWGPGPLPSYGQIRVDYLAMGTFAPAIDYLTMKKIRKEIMLVDTVKDSGQGVTSPIDVSVMAHYCSDWGYSESDPQWIDALSGTVGTTGQSGRTSFTKATMRVSGPRIKTPASLTVDIGAGEIRLSIQSLDGRIVRDLGRTQGAELFWDTRDSAGRPVSAGTYIVKAAMGGRYTAATIIVQ